MYLILARLCYLLGDPNKLLEPRQRTKQAAERRSKETNMIDDLKKRAVERLNVILEPMQDEMG
jgi:hypothetical protein